MLEVFAVLDSAFTIGLGHAQVLNGIGSLSVDARDIILNVSVELSLGIDVHLKLAVNLVGGILVFK